MKTNQEIVQIDWKHLATTPGYKSLKAAYISDVQDAAKDKRPMRKKSEFRRNFQWAINRAKHYASQSGVSIESVLNKWEEKRSYWWLNYYQDSNQPKFHSGTIKTMGVRGLRRYLKKDLHYKNNPAEARKHIQRFRDKPEKTKPRWSAAKKKRGY